MMKIILPSLSLILYMNFMNFFTLLSTMLILFIMLKINNYMMIINSSFMLDNLSYMMIMLTIISTLLIMLSSIQFKKISILLSSIMMILLMTFSTSNLFYFYIFFEMVLIPTMILITKMGMQPERLQAGIYLIMYTILASLPLLCSIIFLKNNMTFMFLYYSLYNFKFTIFISLAFLVKMPMYFTHLWLPKAHVEAPLEGSMILAAVLLKLGGYGLIRIIPICMFNLKLMTPWIMSISLLGASMTSLNCIRQKDMKSLIAYSSVAHMALTLSSIFIFNKFSMLGAILMMIAHGLSSSALFLLVNDLYLKSHSRNIIILKGMTMISPNMSMWWFLFLAINISAPPSINTISEIFIMMSVMSWNTMMIIPTMLASFFVASFSMSMYINMFHNTIEMKFFKNSPQKIYLSLFIHLIPLLMIITKMELFN